MTKSFQAFNWQKRISYLNSEVISNKHVFPLDWLCTFNPSFKMSGCQAVKWKDNTSNWCLYVRWERTWRRLNQRSANYFQVPTSFVLVGRFNGPHYACPRAVLGNHSLRNAGLNHLEKIDFTWKGQGILKSFKSGHFVWVNPHHNCNCSHLLHDLRFLGN